MGWIASLLVAFLTAVAAAIGSGYVADLSVGWYRISSREGGSGYFVIFMGLLGCLGGAVISLVVSRIVAAGASPGFLKALGLSLGAVAVLLGTIAGLARAAADVPPEIDGEPLWLQVEVRFPADWTVSAEEKAGEALLRLGTAGTLSRTVRLQREGLLFVDDARLEDGRRVVPGFVGIFTGRGARILDVVVEGKTVAGFIVPLPGRPGPAQREWSEWLPRPRPDGGAPTYPLTYRFRVRKQSEPLRVEVFGPFEIETACEELFMTSDRARLPLSARSRLRIRHRGQPVEFHGAPEDERAEGMRVTEAEAVIAVAAPRPALLVRARSGQYAAGTYLVEEKEGTIRAVYLGRTDDGQIRIHEVTSDPERFAASRERVESRGWFDRSGLGQEGLYLVEGDSVVDTRRLSVHHLPRVDGVSLAYAAPPIGLSPDERSLVRFGTAEGDENRPVLVVTDFVTGGSYQVPVDAARMRLPRSERVGPAWVSHHFAWTRGADGGFRLAERPGVSPLPYRGELVDMGSGSRGYRLDGAGERVQAALADLLVKELGAERLPRPSYGTTLPLRIDGRGVDVSALGDGEYVLVSFSSGPSGAPEPDRELMERIASRLDAELATGKLDALFTKGRDGASAISRGS